MIDGVGGGKKSGEKNFFFSDVAKKIGKTWQKSVEKKKLASGASVGVELVYSKE